jgi:purine-nucleoside/S-methyl-5'-thioadenosine phosphorylase / adenosine deaminase
VCGESPLVADAATTTVSNKGCVVMTADCMPVLLCDRSGSRVAAVHAGWRGMEQGVIQQALQYFDAPSEVIAYLGPTISKKHFEVGAEVKAAFESRYAEYASAFRLKSPKGGCEGEDGYVNKYLGDLYAVARMLLNKEGVTQVYGGDFCTFDESDRFHSFRRDGARSGRLASLIYLA